MPILNLNSKSEDFVVGQDDLGDLEVRQDGDSAFHFFYDKKQKRLIKHFVLEEGKLVSTVCDVSLIKKEGEHYTPRLRYWKRDRKKHVAEEQGPHEASVKASVNLQDCHEAFWQLMEFLRTYLATDLDATEFVVASGEEVALLEDISRGRIDGDLLQAIASAIAESEDSAGLLAASDAGQALADLLQQRRNMGFLEELDSLVRQETVTEPDVQAKIRGQWWIFGGRFVGEAERRDLTVLDEIDIPLIRADGTLHIVELKSPRVPTLIRSHRERLIVGDEISKAVGQVMNYLQVADEHRMPIEENLGVDCRRSFATVVIGHSAHTESSPSEIANTLRTFTSHLARVDIVTYEELIDGARRSLSVSEG